MVRRLVEHQQVRVGDDEAGERGTGLLATGQGARRLEPSRPGRSRAPTAWRRRAGRGCTRRGPRSGAGDRRRRARSPGDRCSSSASSAAIASRWAAPVRTAVRRSGEAMNAASKCASWASSPRLSPRLRWTVPRSGSSSPAASRSSVVLPAPFGPTSPIRSPSATAAVTSSRITNVPISRLTLSSRSRLTGALPGRRPAPSRPGRRPGAPAAARFVRSVRARCAARSASAGVSPSAPSAGELGPATAAPCARGRAAGHRPEDPPRRPAGRPPAGAGTTSRSGSTGPR